MSSVCAITVWAGDCAYDISKAGLNMLSDHIAVEYGSRGIRSNALMPGAIRTELDETVMAAMNNNSHVIHMVVAMGWRRSCIVDQSHATPTAATIASVSVTGN